MTAPELLRDAALPPVGTSLLVGVSGGLDSVVLAHALVATGYRAVIAHVHHGMRGESANLDLDLTRRLAQDLDCPFQSIRLSVRPHTGESTQAVARDVRYGALAEMAQNRSIAHVAVGHHASDQAETLLLNLARGSGPAGLGGMSPNGPFPNQPDLRLIRPLLAQSRRHISEYAEANGLVWREDPTNADTRYRRNALRKHVMPGLDKVFGEGVMHAISRSARLLREYEDGDVGMVSRVLLALAAEPLDGRHLPVEGGLLGAEPLGALPEIWRHRLILDALQRWIPAAPRTEAAARIVASLLDGQSGKHVRLGEGEVWRERTGLAFVAAADIPPPVKLSLGRPARFGRFTVSADVPGVRIDPEPAHRIMVSTPGPFKLRAWQPGDRIALKGGTKKVKALLTEALVPCFSRSTAPVLVHRDDVIWVPGLRASVLFELSPASTKGVELSCCVD